MKPRLLWTLGLLLTLGYAHAPPTPDSEAAIKTASEALPAGATPGAAADWILDKSSEVLGTAHLSTVKTIVETGTMELIGQGIANMATPLFGGFAVTGAIARTATNIRNGGTSPLSGIVHSATLVLIVLFLAPLAVHVPLAALAAILFVVAWNMSEARHFVKMIKRAPRADTVILLVTFGLTVFADLVVAVNIGVILATLHFLRRMASSVEVQRVSEQDLHRELAPQGDLELALHAREVRREPVVAVAQIDGVQLEDDGRRRRQ